MNKIVELIVNMEEFEFEDLGVDVLSLVDRPAIEVEWMAFAKELGFRENPDCPDGFEHEMPDGTWMCGKTMGGYTAKFVDKIPGESEDDYMGRCIPVLKGEGYGDDQAAAICYDSFKCPEDQDCYDLDDACWAGYEAIGVKVLNGRTVPNCVPIQNSVDNSGFEKFETFFNDNIDLFKKPGVGAAGDGSIDHAEQKRLLTEAGINTEYPFGYCFQVAQFLFYASGGYSGAYALKCIKGMIYQVDGVDFASTHWYIQHKGNNTIVDLTASQFDGLLDIDKYYEKGRNANLGYPYYNVGDTRVEFDETVPSLQTLKLYSKWREDNEEIPVLEDYYSKAKYEELRKEFTEESFAESTNEVDDVRTAFEKAVIKIAEEVGETIDPSEVIYIDGTKESFATVGDFLQGARAVAALGDLPASTPARLVYRYAGPSGQRFFCRVMKSLNKIYSREDITRMNRLNPGFGPGGSNSYSIFEYKGGPNCQHYWEELVQFQDGSRNVLVSNGPARGDAGRSNNSDDQSPDGSVSNNAYLMSKTWNFSDDDKMIVTGPAMIPRQLIARKDEMGNVFHVYFSRETIETIARKFLADNNSHNTDVNHDGAVTQENTLLESWIVEDPKMDKSTAIGFDVPEGTWMTSMKINNKDTWNKIKAGELNGFSVEGSFLEVVQKN